MEQIFLSYRRGSICFVFLFVLVSSYPCFSEQVVIVNTTGKLFQALKQAELSPNATEIKLDAGEYSFDRPMIIGLPHMKISGADRDKVILYGSGMKTGISQIFVIEASDVTIENLTLGNVRNHGIQVRGESGASNITIRNVKFVDTGEQMLKVSYDSKRPEKYSANGLVEDCLFTYSAGIGPQFYIGGIDAHNARNWIVRNSRFENIRSPESRLAEHAIHFWSGSENTLVENNKIFNCDRGIGFGLGKRGHSGGIIRNNYVQTVRDVGIGLESAVGAQVVDNDVVTDNYSNSIEYRFPASRDILIQGNKASGRIVNRDGGQAVVR